MTDQVFVVWAEIPVTDMDAAMKFYGDVFGWKLTLDTSGPNPMAIFSGAPGSVGGHLYRGKPAVDGAGSTIHLAVPDSLAAATERCKAAGGTVGIGPITIPPGNFTYCTDPDGNSIGLFEFKAR